MSAAPEPGFHRPPTVVERARMAQRSAAQKAARLAELQAALERAEGRRWCRNHDGLARPGKTRCPGCESHHARRGTERPPRTPTPPSCQNPNGCPLEVEKAARCCACRKWLQRHDGEERPRAVIDEALARRADRLRDQGRRQPGDNLHL